MNVNGTSGVSLPRCAIPHTKRVEFAGWLTISVEEQVEHNLPNWLMEMFTDFDIHRQCWTINPAKLAAGKHEVEG